MRFARTNPTAKEVSENGIGCVSRIGPIAEESPGNAAFPASMEGARLLAGHLENWMKME